jgi:hypothetical protein
MTNLITVHSGVDYFLDPISTLSSIVSCGFLLLQSCGLSIVTDFSFVTHPIDCTVFTTWITPVNIWDENKPIPIDVINAFTIAEIFFAGIFFTYLRLITQKQFRIKLFSWKLRWNSESKSGYHRYNTVDDSPLSASARKKVSFDEKPEIPSTTLPFNDRGSSSSRHWESSNNFSRPGSNRFSHLLEMNSEHEENNFSLIPQAIQQKTRYYVIYMFIVELVHFLYFVFLIILWRILVHYGNPSAAAKAKITDPTINSILFLATFVPLLLFTVPCVYILSWRVRHVFFWEEGKQLVNVLSNVTQNPIF